MLTTTCLSNNAASERASHFVLLPQAPASINQNTNTMPGHFVWLHKGDTTLRTSQLMYQSERFSFACRIQ